MGYIGWSSSLQIPYSKLVGHHIHVHACTNLPEYNQFLRLGIQCPGLVYTYVFEVLSRLVRWFFSLKLLCST